MINDSIKKDRHLFIGGSDTAVYGLNPFKSPYELWEEKTQMKQLEEISNEHIAFGNEAEQVIKDCINKLLISSSSRINGLISETTF